MSDYGVAGEDGSKDSKITGFGGRVDEVEVVEKDTGEGSLWDNNHGKVDCVDCKE
jgi:hypothetical protein